MQKQVKKISAYVWAFFALLFVFVVAGVSSLGSVRSTGGRLSYVADEKAYYTLELNGDETLDAVYVNIGAIYTKVGEDASVTVQYSASSVSTPSPSWTTFGSAVKLANIHSETGKSGVNYNWVKIADGQKKSNVKQLSFSADRNLELNELVCLNEVGEKIELSASSRNAVFAVADVSKTVDKQNSFHVKSDAYHNFTQDEAYTLTTIENILSGSATYEGSVYTLTQEHNYLASLLLLPTVAAFGGIVFSLRLTPFLATVALLIFAWLLARELTKSDRCAFFFALLIAFAGYTTTLARLGGAFALVTSAVVASVYFAYRFFAKGISSARVKRDGLNVFFSGVFAAFSLAMDASAIFPVLGVLVLLGLGLRRQRRARALALEKAGDIEEERAQVVRTYAYKTRVCYAYAALSFVALTFALLVFSTLVCFAPAFKAYGAETGFATALWKGVANSFVGGNATKYAAKNAGSVFLWWLPIGETTLYDGVAAVSAARKVRVALSLNPALIVLCPLAFLGATAKIVYDFIKKKTDKGARRIRRTYFLFAAGLLAGTLAGAFKTNVSFLYAGLFWLSYIGFLPLLLLALMNSENKKIKLVVTLCAWLVVAAAIVAFALSIVLIYGVAVLA